MCGAFTADCEYDTNTIILLRDVFCPKTKCSGKLCLYKNTFQSPGGNDFRCPQCASVYQVRNNRFEDQTQSFSLPFRQGVFVFEESSKSIRDVIEDL